MKFCAIYNVSSLRSVKSYLFSNLISTLGYPDGSAFAVTDLVSTSGLLFLLLPNILAIPFSSVDGSFGGAYTGIG
jgi:hypothetical protein